jgi:hypothetical protein
MALKGSEQVSKLTDASEAQWGFDAAMFSRSWPPASILQSYKFFALQKIEYENYLLFGKKNIECKWVIVLHNNLFDR